MRLARILLGLGLALLAAGCSDDYGYLELKTVPVLGRGPALFLDNEQLEAPRDGVAVLRQPAGTRKLQSRPSSGEFATLCEVVVRKDRITTVTVSVLERPPRCQCARPKGHDPESRRVCLG